MSNLCKPIFWVVVASLLVLAGCSGSQGGMSAANRHKDPIDRGAAGSMDSSDFSSEYRSGVTLVYFAKPACPACAQQDPIFQEVQQELPSGTKATKVYGYMVNDDRYGVTKYPTLMVFKEGKPVWDHVGVASKNSLIRALKNAK